MLQAPMVLIDGLYVGITKEVSDVSVSNRDSYQIILVNQNVNIVFLDALV